MSKYFYRQKCPRHENNIFCRAPIRLPFQNFENFHDFFNMTLTYRTDSDIQWRYGYVKEYRTRKYIAPAPAPNWVSPTKNFKGLFLFLSKKSTNQFQNIF